ncbi:MAG: GDP-mannose 4,6-dehydratase [Candidatus Aminicenantes bacterium]|nr:GDP-mannose 4,6-dehydratase [Candidatus Aminicenantes bacterium]
MNPATPGGGRRVLITGATGFVGRYLSRELAGVAGSAPASPAFEVFGTSFPDHPAPGEPNISFLDLRNAQAVRDVLRRTRPEWIFHLAAVSQVRMSWEKREETFEANVMGTFYLFEAVRQELPSARVLFVSSSDVYGIVTETDKVLTEDDPVRAVNPYACTKAAGELLTRFYTDVEKLDIVTARPFPHTGPGQGPDFVCSDWARQLVRVERGEAQPTIRVGNLDVCRDFVDVRDVVRAYVLLLEKGRRGEVYNVCRGTAVPLREILDTLITEVGLRPRLPVTVEVDPAKLRKTDQPLLRGSAAKLRAETGWTPRVDFRETLRDLLAYWRAQA